MRTDRVRRAAAKAAVTASRNSGRPVAPAVAALAACPNCDDRKCMGCVCRDPQHDCVDDCPMCGPTALRERIAAVAVAVMVGSPHVAKTEVSQIAWDVAGAVVDRVLGGPNEHRG